MIAVTSTCTIDVTDFNEAEMALLMDIAMDRNGTHDFAGCRYTAAVAILRINKVSITPALDAVLVETCIAPDPAVVAA
jgi:hypothetical protein